MTNTTIGVDTSATSISSPTITFTTESVTTPAGPEKPLLARPENIGTVCTVVNEIVTPNLQILLASVLGTIDASIPNKEQNRAVKHIVRKQFDDAYIDIQRRAYPDCAFGSSPEYYLEPNAKAFQVGTIRA
jgi:hypothetical protein